MGRAIGIDLGTTNSVVAHEGTAGVEVLLNSLNERSTRSVVGIHARSGERLVGSPAWDNAARNPENTILSVKRLIGRFYDDPNVMRVRETFKYHVVKADDGDDARVRLGDEVCTPTEVSAMILRKVKEDAERRLGDEISHAVITVPAYFSTNQRQATRTAGEMAGLRVKSIISEPSAAAMSFGVGLHETDMKNVLVYDMGGGTFDISVLFITGEMFNELAIEGDVWLGGDDFDHAIVRHVLGEIQREHGVDMSGNSSFMLLLKKAAERAKIQLSEITATSIVLEAAIPVAGGDREDVDMEFTRAQFEDLPIGDRALVVSGVPREEMEQWCVELKINGVFSDRGVEFGPDTVRNRVKKSLLLTRKALCEARLHRDEIDHVLLVGGSTTIPLVQRLLVEEFGAAKIMRNIDPMECVARGAGIAATRLQSIICQNGLADGTRCQEANSPEAVTCRKCGTTLTAEQHCAGCGCANNLKATQCSSCGMSFKVIEPGNVTAKPIGLLADNGVYEVIVPKCSPYPMLEPVVRSFRTASDTTLAVRVPIYHAEVGEFDSDDVNQWQGAADIRLEGAHLPADTLVDVSIGIDRDGCLDIEAVIQDGTRRRARIFIDPRVGPLAKPARLAFDEGEDPLLKAFGQLKWSLETARLAIESYGNLFDPPALERLRKLMEQGRKALEARDEEVCRRVERDIDQFLSGQMGVFWPVIIGEMRARYAPLEPTAQARLLTQVNAVQRDIRRRAPWEVLEPHVGAICHELTALDEKHEKTANKAAWLRRA